jgi:Fe-S cluster biogenesis protein NfuA
MDEIGITAEPVDERRCKFVVSVPLLAEGVRRFASAEEAQGSALAEALFAVPGVTALLVAGHVVTVHKGDAAPWQSIGRQVGAAIRAAIHSGAPLVASRPVRAGTGADDVLYERVSHLFETRINPMVAGHGGRVDLLDVQDAVVLLRLQGGCQGCGMADVTLRQGIEATLRQFVPEVQGIVDVTDHASGTNPYFAAAKK